MGVVSWVVADVIVLHYTVLHKCYLLDEAKAANAIYMGDREHWCTSDPHITDEMHSVVIELGVRRHQQMVAAHQQLLWKSCGGCGRHLTMKKIGRPCVCSMGRRRDRGRRNWAFPLHAMLSSE